MAKRKKKAKKTAKVGVVRAWKGGGHRKKVAKGKWKKCNSAGKLISSKR